MAALTADVVRNLQKRRGVAAKIKNATTVQSGAFVAIEAATGRLIPNAGAAGSQLIGLADGTPFYGSTAVPSAGGVLGDTSASIEPYFPIDGEGFVLTRATVTGVSAITDLLKAVYLNADDHTLTLTRPTRGHAIGFVSQWHTSTTCDVWCYSLSELVLQQVLGGARDLLHLGYFDWTSIVTGNIRTGIPLAKHGKFIDVFAMVDIACTGAAGTAAINLEIDAVNVTGGVVTVSTAAGGTKGTKLAGTAVTAANEFSEGSVLDIEAVASGTQTTGSFDLFATVEYLPGV